MRVHRVQTESGVSQAPWNPLLFHTKYAEYDVSVDTKFGIGIFAKGLSIQHCLKGYLKSV